MKNNKTILLLLCYYIGLTEVNFVSKKTHGQFLLVIKTWMTFSRMVFSMHFSDENQ